MQLFYRLTVCSTLLFLPFTIAAQDTRPGSEKETIDRLLNTISAYEQLNEIPKSTKSQFAANPLGLEPSRNDILVKHYTEAFIEDSLAGIFNKAFAERYKSEKAAAALKHIDKEAVKKGLQARDNYYTVQGARKQVIRMYELEQNPPSSKRKALITSLIEATAAAETMIEAQVIMFRSLISSFSVLSSSQNFTDAQIDNFVYNYKSQIQSQIQRDVQEKTMIIHYNLDDDTLREYISFFQSDTGQWLSNSFSEALLDTYRKAADHFVSSLNNSE